MRRAELDDGLARGAPGHDTAARMQSPHATDEFDAPAEVQIRPGVAMAESLRDDIRALALKLDDLRRERSDPRDSASI